MPKQALANGLWAGDVPAPLANLSLIEKLLVSRYRHTVCVDEVRKGLKEMKANAVLYTLRCSKSSLLTLLCPCSLSLGFAL